MGENGSNLSVGRDGRRIAVLVEDGAGPSLVWFGGFRSDMTGSKAEALAAFGQRTDRHVVRFDYSGHGSSGGAFEDGTISRWCEEAEAVVDRLAPGPVVLVGSSMGGWIALLVALRLLAGSRAGDLRGLVLVAPAPDFTEDLIYAALPQQARTSLEREGRVQLPDRYGGTPTVITRELIEDGRRHLLLKAPICIPVPVRILQGMRDADVPHAHALRLAERLESSDLLVTLIGDGDHRLSRDVDIGRLLAAVEEVVASQPAAAAATT